MNEAQKIWQHVKQLNFKKLPNDLVVTLHRHGIQFSLIKNDGVFRDDVRWLIMQAVDPDNNPNGTTSYIRSHPNSRAISRNRLGLLLPEDYTITLPKGEWYKESLLLARPSGMNHYFSYHAPVHLYF